LKTPFVQQTVNIGFSRSDLENYLIELGYWDTPEKKERHAYVLSPSAYILSASQNKELQNIARLTYQAVQNLEDYLSILAHQKHLLRHEYSFLRMARSASHGLYKPGEDKDTRIPPLVKIDLVQQQGGEYQVVEIDTYNPRALGTILLTERTLSLVGRKPPYSLAKGLASLLRSAGINSTWVLPVSQHEGYYETSYSMIASTLASYGISLPLMREKDAAQDLSILDTKNSRQFFIIPQSLNRYPTVRDTLVRRYQSGNSNLFYPPKAYLGSKSFLPFLASQEGMKKYIPATVLLNEDSDSDVLSCFTLNGKKACLKATTSSGAKGVLFSDLDQESFTSTLEENKDARTPLWILQEQVDQEQIAISIFGEDDTQLTRDFFVRLTLYVDLNGIVGLKMTARTSPLVHGAADCVQLPVILG